jgi:hypothetical protein
MSTVLALEGARLMVSGTSFRPASYSNAARFSKELESFGASIHTSFEDGVDALIAGISSARRVSAAHKRGVPIIANEDLQMFLADGAILTSADEEPFEPLPSSFDAIGELRSLAAIRAKLDNGVWRRLCEICDRTEHARLEEAVAYIEGSFHRAYTPLSSDEEGIWCHYDLWWDRLARSAKVSDVRVMPPEWLHAMVVEEPSPKHRLARVLVLDLRANLSTKSSLDLSGYKNIQGFATSPDLENITTLHMQYGPKYEWVFELLSQNSSAKNIRTLHLHNMPGSHMHTRRGAVSTLRELVVHTNLFDRSLAPQGLGQMGRSSIGEGITSLSIYSSEGLDQVKKELSYEGCFPALERLVLRRGTDALRQPEDMMDATFLHRLRALRLEFIAPKPKKNSIKRWLELESLTSLRTLDLSGSRGRRPPHDDFEKLLFKAIDSDQPALRDLETLILGRFATPAICDRVHEFYPNIAIT